MRRRVAMVAGQVAEVSRTIPLVATSSPTVSTTTPPQPAESTIPPLPHQVTGTEATSTLIAPRSKCAASNIRDPQPVQNLCQTRDLLNSLPPSLSIVAPLSPAQRRRCRSSVLHFVPAAPPMLAAKHPRRCAGGDSRALYALALTRPGRHPIELSISRPLST